MLLFPLRVSTVVERNGEALLGGGLVSLEWAHVAEKILPAKTTGLGQLDR